MASPDVVRQSQGAQPDTEFLKARDKWWPVWVMLGVGVLGVAASIIAQWIGK